MNWNQGLMRWKPHVNGEGRSFPLNHLHPFRFPLVVSQTPVVISVGFAMHCFSREATPDDTPAELYRDDREMRAFCYDRYALSSRLPEIVRALPERKCEFARNDNFVTIDADGPDGRMRRYGVFFNLKRWKDVGGDGKVKENSNADLLLTVQSAYSLSANKGSPGKGKIGFIRLVELTLQGVKAKPPKR